MRRLISASALILTCSLVVGCDDDLPPTGPIDVPIQVSETFSGTVTINGAATHVFLSTRPGEALATLTSLAPDPATVVSFTFGTWNGIYCQVILAKDDATTGANLIGTASAGTFCVRISDVGLLSAPTDYVITVRHY